MRRQVCDQTFMCWMAPQLGLQEFELSCSPPASKHAYGAHRMRLLNPQMEGLAEPCCFSRSWLRIREANWLHLDESGWLFFGGSVATGARLRFASRGNSWLKFVLETCLHLDRSGMP